MTDRPASLHRAVDRIDHEVGIVARCLLLPAAAPWSKLAFLAGLAYLVLPIDLIPNRLPYIGHLDEIGFVLAGLITARFAAPPALRQRRSGGGMADVWFDALFAVRVLRADLANFFLIQYRSVDAFLITGKNSGTHWVKLMLSRAIAQQYGLPPPSHASGRDADAIIGHPRWPKVHAGLPRFGSSHSIPSIAFVARLKLFDHAPVVLLVRDIGESMLSNFVKWRPRYGVDFATYLRGDPTGRRYVADIWWYIHFFNRWGALALARPGRTLIVHYEDVLVAPGPWLRRMAAHMGVALDDAAIDAALAFVDRAAVQAELDPAYGEAIIPSRAERAEIAFSTADRDRFDTIMGRHLRHRLGYNDLPTVQMGAQEAASVATCRALVR